MTRFVVRGRPAADDHLHYLTKRNGRIHNCADLTPACVLSEYEAAQVKKLATEAGFQGVEKELHQPA